jgi:hypothetical protein
MQGLLFYKVRGKYQHFYHNEYIKIYSVYRLAAPSGKMKGYVNIYIIYLQQLQ